MAEEKMKLKEEEVIIPVKEKRNNELVLNLGQIELNKRRIEGLRRFTLTDGRGGSVELRDIELPRVMNLLRAAYDEIEMERMTRSIFTDIVEYYANSKILKDVYIDQFPESEENLIRVRCIIKDPGTNQLQEKSFWRKFKFLDTEMGVFRQLCYRISNGLVIMCKFTCPELANHKWLKRSTEEKDEGFYIFNGDPMKFLHWSKPAKGEITDFNEYVKQFTEAGYTVGDVLDMYYVSSTKSKPVKAKPAGQSNKVSNNGNTTK